MGATCGVGTAYPSRAHGFTPVLMGFVVGLFHLTIVLTVPLQFMASGYHFGIFKLFLQCILLLFCTSRLTYQSSNIYTCVKNKTVTY